MTSLNVHLQHNPNILLNVMQNQLYQLNTFERKKESFFYLVWSLNYLNGPCSKSNANLSKVLQNKFMANKIPYCSKLDLKFRLLSTMLLYDSHWFLCAKHALLVCVCN